MCCVRIGYQEFLMPADKGMKVVELMTSAVDCDKQYLERGYSYTLRDQPDVSFNLVKPDQIRLPQATAPIQAPTLLIGSNSRKRG
jgi:hypothetical protein